MGNGATRTLERVAAAMGELESAPIEFQPACDVAQGGVLLALPALLAAGLLRYTPEFYELPDGFYGIESIFLLLGLMALARVGQLLHVDDLVDLCGQWAGLSLMLCFFNLIPIPPLDGSQVVRCLTNMSYETYAKLARFGIFAIILVLNIPIIRDTLQTVTSLTLVLLARLFGVA